MPAAARRRDGAVVDRLNPARRVYVSIKPDTRIINPAHGGGEGGTGEGGNNGWVQDRSIALIETAVSDLNAGGYHCWR